MAAFDNKAEQFLVVCFRIRLPEDGFDCKRRCYDFEQELFRRFFDAIDSVVFVGKDEYRCVFTDRIASWQKTFTQVIELYFTDYLLCYSENLVDAKRLEQKLKIFSRVLKQQLFVHGGRMVNDSGYFMETENDIGQISDAIFEYVLKRKDPLLCRPYVSECLNALVHIGVQEAKELLLRLYVKKELWRKHCISSYGEQSEGFEQLAKNLPGTIDELEDTCCNILQELWECKGAVPAQNELEYVVRNVQQYIRKNIYANITREMISDNIGYSPDYISHIFSQKTGKTVVRYIQEEKMREAKRMAEQTCLQVSEISMRLGYSNFSYFSKLFMRENGCSVKECRRKG